MSKHNCCYPCWAKLGAWLPHRRLCRALACPGSGKSSPSCPSPTRCPVRSQECLELKGALGSLLPEPAADSSPCRVPSSPTRPGKPAAQAQVPRPEEAERAHTEPRFLQLKPLFPPGPRRGLLQEGCFGHAPPPSSCRKAHPVCLLGGNGAVQAALESPCLGVGASMPGPRSQLPPQSKDSDPPPDSSQKA